MAPWVVWLVFSEGAQATEAAHLVVRDCETRGVSPLIVQHNDGSEPEAFQQSTQPLIVISPQPPTLSVPPDRLVVVGVEPSVASARTVVPAASAMSSSELALRIVTALEGAKLVPSLPEEVYTPEEEERLRKALDDLGYL